MGGEIASVAERLRLVRVARRKFLRLWAIDQSMIEPLVDRVAADLNTPGNGDAEKGPASAEHPSPPPVDES